MIKIGRPNQSIREHSYYELFRSQPRSPPSRRHYKGHGNERGHARFARRDRFDMAPLMRGGIVIKSVSSSASQTFLPSSNMRGRLQSTMSLPNQTKKLRQYQFYVVSIFVSRTGFFLTSHKKRLSRIELVGSHHRESIFGRKLGSTFC